ncbi:hypothetical protein D3C81_768550 [compost metagenome]
MSDTPENTPEQAPAMFNESFVPPKKPQRKATSKARSAPTDSNGAKLATNSDDPMEKLLCITLHDSKEIPPGGQFVGVNGKQFWIKPGMKVVVPRYVVEALQNAVIGQPDVNDKMQVVGVKNMPRLPFTVHFDWDGQAA